MKNKKRTTGMTVIETVIVSALVIIFFVSTVMLYYHLLLDEKKENMVNTGALAGKEVSNALLDYMSDNKYFVQFSSYLLEEMLDNGAGKEEINNLIVNQAVGLKLESMQNINAYINGDYYCDKDWRITDDYEPTSRPWYTEAIKEGEEVSFIDPYVDYETKVYILSVGKTLKGGKNVFSVDVSLEDINNFTAKVVKENDVDAAMIINERGAVITHSDRDELGKVYSEEIDSIGGVIYKKLSDMDSSADEQSFEFEYNGVNYLVYAETLDNDWKAITLVNTTSTYSALRLILIMTIAIIIGIVAVIIFIMVSSNKRSFLAEREIAAYKERLELEEAQAAKKGGKAAGGDSK